MFSKEHEDKGEEESQLRRSQRSRLTRASFAYPSDFAFGRRDVVRRKKEHGEEKEDEGGELGHG
jgi:hypothetical protein